MIIIEREKQKKNVFFYIIFSRKRKKNKKKIDSYRRCYEKNKKNYLKNKIEKSVIYQYRKLKKKKSYILLQRRKEHIFLKEMIVIEIRKAI